MRLPPDTPESRRAFISAVLADDSHRLSAAIWWRGQAMHHGEQIGPRGADYHAGAASDCEALADLFEHAEHAYQDVPEPWWELFQIKPEQHSSGYRDNLSIERVGV